MLTSSFKQLRDAGACKARYKHLAKALGGITAYGRTKPITFAQILEHNGVEDVLWALFKVNEVDEAKAVVVEWACLCAERSLVVFEKEFPKDKRPREAIKATRQYIQGNITLEKLKEYMNAAIWAAESARWASPMWAAESASRAAACATRSACWSTWAAESAEAAARAIGSNEKQWQQEKLLELLTHHD